LLAEVLKESGKGRKEERKEKRGANKRVFEGSHTVFKLR
jgi:hypothetical protein